MPVTHGPRNFYIGRYPAGLLDLLGAKVNGQTPHQLNEQVSATVDLLPFITSQRRDVVEGSVLLNAVGPFADASGPPVGTLVPNDEFWLVWSFSSQPSATLGAGTTAFWQCFMTRGDGSAEGLVLGTEVTGGAGTFPHAFAATVPFWMKPGQSLGIWSRALTLGIAPTILLRALVTKFKI